MDTHTHVYTCSQQVLWGPRGGWGCLPGTSVDASFSRPYGPSALTVRLLAFPRIHRRRPEPRRGWGIRGACSTDILGHSTGKWVGRQAVSLPAPGSVLLSQVPHCLECQGGPGRPLSNSPRHETSLPDVPVSALITLKCPSAGRFSTMSTGLPEL